MGARAGCLDRGIQRQGPALDLFDRCQQFLFPTVRALFPEHPIHRAGGIPVKCLQLLNIREVALQIPVVLDQYRIADGYGPVMNTAPEVNRVALLHGGAITHVGQCPVDKTDPLVTNKTDGNHQGENQTKAKGCVSQR
ncbi:hypothetical protein SAMN04487869_104144 [Marinobacter sp. DSM 26671]|uniref:hypothetical protein n=1 Tax=Marinobacter sp. DSM 26671 TaxID=1761793 RepID=UPI0008EFD778|nr:hypothetical protein SAMN04487869_104144 [Marinobacter sp. DSM 26671]